MVDIGVASIAPEPIIGSQVWRLKLNSTIRVDITSNESAGQAQVMVLLHWLHYIASN